MWGGKGGSVLLQAPGVLTYWWVLGLPVLQPLLLYLALADELVGGGERAAEEVKD